MAAPSRTAVTPSGIRTGDPGTLDALCARRGTAVLAYCERVCAPGRVADGAADAFARFRGAVVRAADVGTLDPDRLLLSVTRRAAAERAPRAAAERLTRRLSMRRRQSSRCGLVPQLLVARAEDELSVADRQRLDHHLQRCEACRATVERFDSAEQAYRYPPSRTIAPEVARGIRVALMRAAPVTVGEPRANGAGAPPAAPGDPPPAAPADPPPAVAGAALAAEPGLRPAAREGLAPSPDPCPAAPEPSESSTGDAEDPITGYLAPLEREEDEYDETYEHDIAVLEQPESPTLPEPDGAPPSPIPLLEEPEPATPPPPVRRGVLARAAGTLSNGGARRPEARRRGVAREPSSLAGLLESSGRSGGHTGRGWRVALPTAIVGLALLAALAVAGVFSASPRHSAAHLSNPPTGTPQGVPQDALQPPPAPRAGGGHRATRRHRSRPAKPAASQRATKATTTATAPTTTTPPTPVSSSPPATTTAPAHTAPAAPPAPSTPPPTRTSPSRVQAVGPSSQAAPPAGNAPPASPGYQPGR